MASGPIHPSGSFRDRIHARDVAALLLLLLVLGCRANHTAAATPLCADDGTDREFLRLEADGPDEDGPRTPAPTQRAAGRLGLHAALGSVNGVRFGMRYHVHPVLNIEADGGYVRISLREENGTSYTDGWSVSGGANWYALPHAEVTPLVSLLVAYTQSTVLPRGNRQRRVAIIPSLGSEYFMTRGFSLFFRFGPAIQLTEDLDGSHLETVAQFDAGLAWVF